jgi:hypothetical protein
MHPFAAQAKTHADSRDKQGQVSFMGISGCQGPFLSGVAVILSHGTRFWESAANVANFGPDIRRD